MKSNSTTRRRLASTASRSFAKHENAIGEIPLLHERVGPQGSDQVLTRDMLRSILWAGYVLVRLYTFIPIAMACSLTPP